MQEYQSHDITKLAKALLNVQKGLQPAAKDSVNPFVKNRYASLNSVMDVCREPLLSNGIWLCQYPVPAESTPLENTPQAYSLGLVTKLTHAESGQWQSSLTVIPLSKADPQSMGSAMSYARRYALSAMLGIVTEEDTDGMSGNYQQNQGAQNGRNSKNSQSQQKATSNRKSGHSDSNIENKNLKAQNGFYEDGKNGANSDCQLQIPILSGVVYDSFDGQGEKGNRREVITATGNTIPYKDELIKSGFKWNPNKKVWWKYA